MSLPALFLSFPVTTITKSTAPIAELARESQDDAYALEQERATTALKRKYDELEFYRLETNVQQQRTMGVQNLIGVMDYINPEWKKDTRLCLQLQDNLLIMSSNVDRHLQLEADRLKKMVEEQANAIREKDSQLKVTKHMLGTIASEKERVLNGKLTSDEIKKIIEVDAFSIQDVLGGRTVKDKCQFSREVMTEFRGKNHPYFFRNGLVHFYQCDRELVENLVNYHLVLEESVSGPSGPALNVAEF